MMNKYIITLLLPLLCVSFIWSQTDYETDVLPIFEVNCAGCHGFNGSGFSSGLDLTDEFGVLSGANSGEVVVFGDYESSVLYERIIGVGGYMPPSWSSNDQLSIEEVNIVTAWIAALNDGCTDPNALNYDENAVNDDGSCEYDEPWEVFATDCNMTIALLSDLEILFNGTTISDPIWLGVTNADGYVSGMSLYTPGETTSITVWGDDASTSEYDGMLGGEEFNWIVSYNNIVGVATLDFSIEYSCNGMSVIPSESIIDAVSEQDVIPGCNDPLACNYDSEVTEDDGSCLYPDIILCQVCDGSGGIIVQDDDADGVCNENEVVGCTDDTACLNYNPLATDDDGSCQYEDSCGVCGGDDTLCLGCTDTSACNYGGISITIDDGSCEYVTCAGCTDFEACNYNPSFTIDDGSCDYSCLGCTDPNACNYSSEATVDNGSCDYDACVGCTDPAACNYNAIATEDDDSCEYQSCVGCLDVNACNYNDSATIDCSDEGIEDCCTYVDDSCDVCENGELINNDLDDDGICDDDEIEGCTDIVACNYNELATEDIGCIYINENDLCSFCSGETDGSGIVVNNDSDADGICDENDPCPDNPDNDANNNGVWDCEEIVGCTDTIACNYSETANVDDGSCLYPGCNDITACNYDETAGCLDESACIYGGCTNPDACNYDSGAPCDDGSCESSA